MGRGHTGGPVDGRRSPPRAAQRPGRAPAGPRNEAADAVAGRASDEPGAVELDRIRAALAGAAHELRGPATVLAGMAEMLATERDSLDPATFDRMIDAIRRQARVLDRVTGDLLTSSQSQRGVLTVDVEPLLLRPVLESAALGLAAAVRPQLRCPDDLWVRGDATRVSQMAGNLLSNAVKYGAAPISVTVSRAGRDAVVRVADHGPGVPEPFRGQLFRQFSRAAGAHPPGMGLGLFVVRSLAEAQGGGAWYEPAPAGGSCFCFSLPLAQARSPVPALHS